MKVSIQLVTPELANEWLEENNIKNRPIKQSSVDTLTDLMLKDLYKENGESIIFSDRRRLLDGQHRLQAVVKSGKSYRFVIVEDVPDPYFDTIDIGKPRSVGDILGIIGKSGGNEIAAVARIAIYFERKLQVSGGGRNVLSPKEIAEYIYDNDYVVDITQLAKKHRGPFALSPLASVLYLGNKSRQFDNDVKSFLEKVKTGEGLTRGNPILAFREWMIAEKAKSHSLVPKEVLFEITAKVWTSWMEQKNLTVIKPRTIIGREVEIFGCTNFAGGDRVSLRTRPSQEVPNTPVAPS